MSNVTLKTTKKFFLGANTPMGFVSYFNQIGEYKENWHRFLIKGGPGTGKSSLMKNIISEFKDIANDIETIYCSSDPNSVDGVILNDLKTSIVDATAPHVLEPVFPGTFDEIVSICECWDECILKDNTNKIIKLFEQNLFYRKQVSNLLLSAYGFIKNNYEIIEKFIDKNVFQKYSNELIDELDIIRDKDKFVVGGEQKRFLSVISVDGSIFYDETISKIANKIYIIEDPYGWVGNNILLKIREKLLQYNIEFITCYCSMFSGKKIDHILVPSIQIAFITSNKYHKFTGDSIKIINSNNFIKSIDNNLKNQINVNIESIEKIINMASKFVKEAKYLHDELEEYYIKSMNFNLVDDKTKMLINKIKTFIN